MTFQSIASRGTLAAIVIALVAATNVTNANTSAETGTRETALELALSPAILAVADLHEYAQTMLYRIDNAHELRQSLKSARQEVSSAMTSVSSLAQAVSTGAGGTDAVAQYEAAVAHLQTTQAQLVQVRQAILDAATVNLPSEKLQLLNKCRANASFAIPESFRVKQKTAVEWKALEGALRAEARASRRGEELDSEMAHLLSSMRTDFDVIAAGARLTSYLSAVEDAFEAYAN